MGLAKEKRVTVQLDDEARARLVGAAECNQLGYISSGSEHSADGGDDSPCLSELVHDFLEDNETEGESGGNEVDSDRVDLVSDCREHIEDTVRLNSVRNADPYRKILLAHVSMAAEKFTFMRSSVSIFRRNVMSFLREKGHNAAICRTRWDSSGGVTSGNHEFIDVVQSGPSNWQNRYFVELDFPAQFEIARATNQYTEILKCLPRIFVGRAEELKRIVRAMCHVAKKCFRSRGLSVPPWRKNRYMQNKWFAPYKRTTNPVQGNPVAVAASAVTGANCRLIGFDEVVLQIRHGGGVDVRTR